MRKKNDINVSNLFFSRLYITTPFNIDNKMIQHSIKHWHNQPTHTYFLLFPSHTPTFFFYDDMVEKNKMFLPIL
jgi:hypothetical protein